MTLHHIHTTRRQPRGKQAPEPQAAKAGPRPTLHHTPISSAMSLLLTIRDLDAPTDPDRRTELILGALNLERQILSTQAENKLDILIKLRLWAELIEDPDAIVEEHAAMFGQLRQEIQAMILPA